MGQIHWIVSPLNRAAAARCPEEVRVKAREDIRNVAIIAHVDHGKTTLVDAMLRQSGAFGAHETLTDRVMDSLDLEREKGITILAKNASVRWKDVKVNIVDTPGHADFGGEVERALTMVDGVILLVDAAEGPLPQTRFVLCKALADDLPVILIINKIDRQDARPAAVLDEVYELFLDLDAHETQIDFPVLYAVARDGRAGSDPNDLADDLSPLFELLVSHTPPPQHDPDHPLQAWVTNLDSSPYVGRLAMCRVMNGVISKGESLGWSRVDGSVERVKIAELYVTENLERVPVLQAGPGELIALAGIPDVTIGETITDADDPRPLDLIVVDEPSLSMTIGTNTSPLAGEDGKKLTARQIKDRLDAELIGNVSIRVFDTEQSDAWEVQGRGELQLAVLVETMRREGFELTVGKPQVVTREIDGVLNEPMERVSIDVPEEYLGAVSQMLAVRKAQMQQMINHGTGWVRFEHIVPARALIGFRTEFMTETRGTGQLHHVFDGWAPWHGEMRMRPSGSLIADRKGPSTPYAIINVQERSSLFIEPGVMVYEGMIIGENPRPEDMDVNICRVKKQTNIRTHSSDDTIRITPPRPMSLEQALEFIGPDECVEVTPERVRLRKVELNAGKRIRTRKSMKADRT